MPARPVAADEPVPTLNRRYAAGTNSARGLLITVLGELMLPSGGTAYTSAFIDVLGRLGTEEKASRQALMRTAADGWLVSERVGRRTRWSLSATAAEFLTEGIERVYDFQAEQPDWDGQWLLVLTRVPETDRAARHHIRTRLRWAGFGSPAPGIWICTHADRISELEHILRDAGTLHDTQIFTAHHRHGELSTLVHQAWDLERTGQLYRDFIEEFDRPAADHLARTIELFHAWRRFPCDDPALPAGLLPPRWPGRRAAKLFQKQRTKWGPTARSEWQHLTETAT